MHQDASLGLIEVQVHCVVPDLFVPDQSLGYFADYGQSAWEKQEVVEICVGEGDWDLVELGCVLFVLVFADETKLFVGIEG
jgi:hypothetical protein